MRKKVLMVCLGNICRSPIAEAVFQETIKKNELEKEWFVDSAAIIGWHSGEPPDERAISVLKSKGIQYRGAARQITENDFENFDYIFGMDDTNMTELRKIKPNGSKAKLLLLGNFGLEDKDRTIEDPFYLVGEAPFEKVYDQCVLACEAFFKSL